MVVCTATASGKSLCYNLPILEALAQDRKATALYMFPTKALAQDQLRALQELCDWTFGKQAPFVDIYDGDTPKASMQASKTMPQASHISATAPCSPPRICRGVPQAWLVCSLKRSGAQRSAGDRRQHNPLFSTAARSQGKDNSDAHQA